MKTISIPDEWRDLIAEIERTGEPVAIQCGDQICGVLLRHDDAQRVASRYADLSRHRADTAPSDYTPTYLDLLRTDPTLVPNVNGRALRFVTMMNSSYVDPQQLYQFEDPHTGEQHVFRADELKEAIGRSFAPVDFVAEALRQWKERRNG